MVPIADITVVLDASGSMEGSPEHATRMAFNAYVEALKKVKGAQIYLTLMIFPYGSRQSYQNVPIQDVKPLGPIDCDGGTPLYKFMVKAIRLAEERIATHGPRKVVIACQTDGGSEVDYRMNCHAAVTAKRAEGWQFNYMGTGNVLDHVTQAASMNIPKANVSVYGTSNEATEKAFAELAKAAAAFSTGRKDTTALK